MARNVIVNWQLPTERSPGEPLDVAEIAHVTLSIKLKAAPPEAWSKIADVPPTKLTRRLENVPAGTYVIRGVIQGVVAEDVSGPLIAEITVPKGEMPPLADLTATLE